MTPREAELTSRAGAWVAWHMGELRMSRDFLEAGRHLLVLYVAVAQLCATKQLAQESLHAGWCWSEQQAEPASHDQVLSCWAERQATPCASLLEMLAHIGALYLMCVEGRLPKEQALALDELWSHRPALLSQAIRVRDPGGGVS